MGPADERWRKVDFEALLRRVRLAARSGAAPRSRATQPPGREASIAGDGEPSGEGWGWDDCVLSYAGGGHKAETKLRTRLIFTGECVRLSLLAHRVC
jgi:hypothetical protein